MTANPYNGFPGAYRTKQAAKQNLLFKSGKMRRPNSCKACGLTEQEGATIHCHSEDYSNIHETFGVCFSCHMAIHRRFKDLATWQKWCDLISDGWQPPYGRDYERFLETWYGVSREIVERPNALNWLHSLPLVEPNLYNPTEGQLWDEQLS